MTWNPKPFVPWSDVETSDYHAGYSDGYHNYQFGAGVTEPKRNNTYHAGYNDGQSDAKATLDKIAAEVKQIALKTPVQIAINGKIYP